MVQVVLESGAAPENVDEMYDVHGGVHRFREGSKMEYYFYRVREPDGHIMRFLTPDTYFGILARNHLDQLQVGDWADDEVHNPLARLMAVSARGDAKAAKIMRDRSISTAKWHTRRLEVASWIVDFDHHLVHEDDEED